MGLWVSIPLAMHRLGWGSLAGESSTFDAAFGWLGLAGSAHAITVALAAQSNVRTRRRITFVLATGVVAFLAAKLAFYIGLSGDFFVGLIVASSGGAAAYWWLIRRMLLSALPTKVLVQALVACPLATIVGGFVSKSLSIDAFTLLWWLAFSLCLLGGTRSAMTATNGVQPSGKDQPAADAAR
jgi:hypothetical protein